jgi:hypothetical protein
LDIATIAVSVVYNYLRSGADAQHAVHAVVDTAAGILAKNKAALSDQYGDYSDYVSDRKAHNKYVLN